MVNGFKETAAQFANCCINIKNLLALCIWDKTIYDYTRFHAESFLIALPLFF